MRSLRSEYLFTLTGEVGPPQVVGDTPMGRRLIIPVVGGHFEGPKLRGKVLSGGTDWLMVRGDGSFHLDVRITLQTDDDHLIGMTYGGIRHASPEVMKRLTAGEPVDASEYYFRVVPAFEAGPGPYEWMNRIVAVAVGDRRPTGPIYEVHEIL